ncbi:MAG: 3-methyladenine DNA glycosylase, partial [Watsoniomyces obsoletus]
MSVRRSTRISDASGAAATFATVPEAKKRSAEDIGKTVAPKKPRTTKKSAGNEAEPEFKKPALPTTPLRKRRAAAVTDVPSLTPTPSLVNIIRAPYSSGDIDDATPPPEDRPVGTHVTNAKLVTPGGSEKVAYSNGIPDSSPSKTGLPRPIGTT